MESLPQKKRSLILAGGGVRLAYHAGVFKALEEHGLSFNHIDGTSGGIFGTAMIASGISSSEAAKRWRNLKLTGFLSALPLKNYFGRRNLIALGSANGIRRKIFPALGIDLKKINSQTAFAATFNVCNFSNKTIEAVPQSAVTEDHLIAGMSLPIFMPAVKINNDWYTDAVWIKDANLSEAINRGAEEIWLIWCIGNNRQYLNGVLNQYVHMIEMSANGGLFNEIDDLKLLNDARLKEDMKPIELHIVKPKYPLPLDPEFLINHINADTLINMGYADSKQYLANPVQFDLSLSPSSSTGMSEPGTTVHFRQQFFGEIALKNKQYQVAVYLSLFFREINHSVVPTLYSSISLDGENFISGYDNRLIMMGNGIIVPSFLFIFNSQRNEICLEISLQSLSGFLFGLEGKKAKANLIADGAKSKPYQLYQPAVNRIKNAFNLYTNAETGWIEKRRAKLRILETVFEEKKETSNLELHSKAKS